MRWISLALLFLTTLIAYADKVVIGLAAVPMMNDFSLTPSQWGIVGSSFSILYIFTTVIGGAWSDRIGTTRMLFLVLAGISFLQLGALAIFGFSMLIIYRLLLGAIEGPLFPSGLSHISKIFPPHMRGLSMSVMIAGGSIGGLISAPILVGLIEKIGWRWTFVSMGFFSLAILLVWMIVDRFDKNKLAHKSTAAPKLKWSEVAPVLRNPACILTIALSASSFWLITWAVLWAPLYLTKIIKLTPMQMAYTVSGTGVVSLLLVFFVSTVSDRIFKKTESFRKSRVWVAAISTLIGGLALAAIPSLGNSILWIFLALAFAKGAANIIISMSAQIMIKLMPERAGFMASILGVGNNIAQLLAPLLTGIFVQAAGSNIALGFHYSIYVIVGLFISIAVLYFFFVKPDDVRNATPAASQ